jgi:putative peptide zinc metalloprotease protein
MATSSFHPHWYRVAGLHPSLRGHVTIRRQVVRGQVWYVLADEAEGRHFRLNPVAYRFVGLCDGKRSVEEVWTLMNDALGDEAPTQAEAVGILARLSQGDLLRSEALPDVDMMFEDRSVRREQKRWSQLNPLFFRVGLIDPTSWLDAFEPVLTRLFSRSALALWCVLVAFAGILAASNWQALAHHAAERTASPMFLVLTWLVYPFVKALHELGHALAIRRWGGAVKKVGVTLLLLMPVPWVDAAASSAFRFRSHRLVVSAAGIMVELFLAALAMLFWLAAEPGGVRDAALAVMLIAGVSTLFFNGNPLLRYDGYFILSDAVDLPNLAPHSAAYWIYLIKRHVLRIPAETPAMVRGERPWLLAFGPASLAYRFAIAIAIVLWLSEFSVALASAAAAALLWGFFVKPAIGLYDSLRHGSDDPRQTRRARRVALAAGALLLVGAVIVPLPQRIIADGLIWLPENARVRPETDGFVVRALVADGAVVEPGQILLELADADLIADRDRLYARLAQFQSEQYGILIRQPERASNLAEEIESLRAALRLNDSRLEHLQVRAGSAGRLVIPRESDLPGRFVPRGTEVGYILGDTTPRVRALLSQRDVALVSERVRGAQVWSSERAMAYAATPQRDTPAATRQLPSAALGDRGGGRIVTDVKDEKGLAAAEPLFVVDLDLPGALLERVGARVEVRFDVGFEPLAQQAWRRLRQTFLSHLSHSG